MTDTTNPFVRDKDGKIPNLTAIAKLTRENPLRAVALCKAAGEKLDVWFPMNPQ
ncbi:hypothetical protein LB531_20900 [Mesorhizobium sp. CO1-1-2]|uniref:hypothetical protein n=1 Tax=Mesorhizobium sp. CO1-1-2 TaxID=2876635 RepID=UPI001CCEE17F|nr:hypothetical protein [Mesorhizobium sp. CO1-1-2]MBZ9683120.1 hypothetical protein [Mesorhizobium sp. CO1-1-2]